jgi:phage anti-repressor protein
VTKSTIEAELTALDTASTEAEWLRELMSDLSVVENQYQLFLLTVIIKL